jgi:hypothetical protein
VLSLHGFTVEVVESPTEVARGETIDVLAKVTMLCGCPTQPGGMWDADEYDLSLDLVGEAGVIASTGLTYADETSHYAGALAVPSGLEPGLFRLRIVAVQASRANAGMVERAVTIRP